jgi:hypothetical protein
MTPAPLGPPRCPLCQSTSLTFATQLKLQCDDTSVEAVFQGPDKSWASSGTAGFRVGRCRVCLDCGYVLPFLSETELQQLRERVGTLTPVYGR